MAMLPWLTKRPTTTPAGFWRERRGAAAAEYALLLALIAGGLALSANVLGESISTAMNETSELIDQVEPADQVQQADQGGCDNNGRGTGFGGGNGGGRGQGAGNGRGNSC